MNQNEKLLVRYLVASTKGEKCTMTLSAHELKYLYTQGCAHQIQTLIFSALDNLKELQKLSPDLMTHWTKETIMRSCYQKEHIYQITYILKALKEQNIECLPLKGLILRELYPRPDLRLMGDADLLVHEKDLQAIKHFLKAEGYQEVEDTHAYHVVFSHPHYMSIEIHWALTNHHSFNTAAAIRFENQVWEHTVQSVIGDVPAAMLSLDDHLIYICMHMAKHLNYAGFGLRQLCDLYLLLQKHDADFNWPYVIQTLQAIGIYDFFAMQTAVCELLFGYKIPAALEDLPKYSKSKIALFIGDIFQSGVFGRATYYRSLAVTFTKAKNNEVPYSTSMRQIFFPGYKKLKKVYPYLSRYPYLVMIAWFQHMYQLFIRRDQQPFAKIKALSFTKYSMHKRKQILKIVKL